MREFPVLPKKVKGQIVTYRVINERPEVDGAAAAFEDRDGYPVIRVSPKLCPEFRWQGFFHELIHAAEFEQGLSLPDTSENPTVDRLAMALTGFFIRNNWSLPGE